MNIKSAIKTLSILSLLSSQPLLANSDENILNVTGCSGEGDVCTDLVTMEAYARSKVLNHTSVKSGQGKYDFIMQSDALDEAYLFEYSYIDKRVFIEGPDGRDIEVYKPFVNLISQQKLYGERKTQVDFLVSTNYATERVAKSSANLRTGKDGKSLAIDYDNFCSTTAYPERDPIHMASQCLIALFDAGLWENVNVIERTLTLVGNQSALYAEGGMNAVISEAKAGMSVSMSLEQVKEYTVSFGGPMRFSTNDGYTLILNPTKSGDVEVRRFLIPPGGQDVPVDKKGRLLNDEITENAINGEYSFGRANINFVALMASRTGLASWNNLARLLNSGIDCFKCKIIHLPSAEVSQE